MVELRYLVKLLEQGWQERVLEKLVLKGWDLLELGMQLVVYQPVDLPELELEQEAEQEQDLSEVVELELELELELDQVGVEVESLSVPVIEQEEQIPIPWAVVWELELPVHRQDYLSD